MNFLIKIVSVLILIFSFGYSSTFAEFSNKESLLSDLNNIKSSFEKLSLDKEKELTVKVYAISEKYNNIFSDLGYDEDTIKNLISMGKLDSNFKGNLVVEYTALKNDIISKINTELLLLNNFIDDLTLNYGDISESQNSTFKINLNQYESNLDDYTSIFSSRITELLNKYNTNLDNSVNNINNIVEINSEKLTDLTNFDKSFVIFTSNINDFKKNYEVFRQKFLSYSGEISNFSEIKQLEYVNLLKTNFNALIDKNLEINSSLFVYTTEMKRFADILSENFSYKLDKELNLEYGVLYSESDVNSLLSKYNDIKNKYYDAEGNLKANDVLSSTTILSDIKSYESKILDINKNVLTLIGDTDNSIDTIKIKLENQIIRFYNLNYPDFKEDLSTKIKEKIGFITLENKNAISIAESIDIRYEMLAEKIKSQYNISILKKDVNAFKNKINKFRVITNDSLTLKINNLNFSLDTFVLNREIKHPDFNEYSSLVSKYKDVLGKIFIKFNNKYNDETLDKMNIVLDRVNIALDKKLSKKNRFMLLNVKLNIIEFLHNLD